MVKLNNLVLAPYLFLSVSQGLICSVGHIENSRVFAEYVSAVLKTFTICASEAFGILWVLEAYNICTILGFL